MLVSTVMENAAKSMYESVCVCELLNKINRPTDTLSVTEANVDNSKKHLIDLHDECEERTRMKVTSSVS